MTRTFNIAVIDGDGIGPEVTRAAIQAVAAAAPLSEAEFRWTPYPWGSEFYFANGKMADDDFLDRLAGHDAILLGAVGHPEVQDHITLNGLLLPIRRRFDQYVCLRPAYLYPGVDSPLRDKAPGSIDIQVFRENVEGEYANIGGRLYQHQPADVAVQTSVFTRRGCERIIRAAFELASTGSLASRERQRPEFTERRGNTPVADAPGSPVRVAASASTDPRDPPQLPLTKGGSRKVTSITKSNAQGYGMVLWDEVFTAVAAEFPDIETESLLIDAAVMEFVRRPESFDVVVASNLFGDILTDLAAIVVGSMGLAPSGNIDPTRTHPSMFEPVHGSAPDITGKGIANPLAAILSAAMMLEHLELPAAATAIRGAVAELLANDGPRTADLGGTAKTEEVGEAIAALITQASRKR